MDVRIRYQPPEGAFTTGRRYPVKAECHGLLYPPTGKGGGCCALTGDWYQLTDDTGQIVLVDQHYCREVSPRDNRGTSRGWRKAGDLIAHGS